MKKYSKEFKEKVIAKLFPPHNVDVLDLSAETGIPKDTLYCWRKKYQQNQSGSSEEALSCSLNSDGKFHTVIETASLNEAELSEYCRSKGLYPEQVTAWRTACVEANESRPAKKERDNSRKQVKRIKELESELNRKEKALAEAAALLILKKKLHSLWEEPVDAK